MKINKRIGRIIHFAVFALALAVLLSPFSALAGGSAPPTPSVKDYLLADMATGDVLLANEPDAKVYPASTTKIMTALLLLENEPDLTKKVTVGNEVYTLPNRASTMHAQKGETYTLKDLLYGLMLPSGADAALTIAVDVGGSVQKFVDMMNAKAAQLGMTGTHYVNPHGLHDADHYTTAADLEKLAITAMANTTFREVVSTYSYTLPATNKQAARTIHNTDKLISTSSEDKQYRYQYAIGIKTGFTSEAGGCLIAAAEKDGQTLIAVLLGDGSGLQLKRWTDAVDLFNYGFTQKRIDLFARINAIPLSATIPGGKAETGLTPVIKETSIVRWLNAETVDALNGGATLDVSYSFSTQSPMPTGADVPIGTVTYSYQGTVLYACDITRTPVPTPAHFPWLVIVLIILIIAALLAVVRGRLRVISRRRRHTRRYSRRIGRRF